MSLLDLMISAVGTETLLQFKHHCSAPHKAQKHLMQHILHTNKACQYGRQYDFSGIHSFKDFQKRIPISTYSSLSPYIDAALQGKPGMLTEEEPILFATTSGTTGQQKYIPVTEKSKHIKSRLTRTWISGIHRDHPDIFKGHILSVVSPEVEEYAPCGTPCGAESGQGYRNIPAALKKLYSQPYEIFTIKDYDAKYYSLLRIAASQSISFIYSCNPSTILLLGQRLAENGEEIIRDVYDGTLSRKYNLSDEIRAIIQPSLYPDPDRAHFLEKAANLADGSLLAKNVWPDLQLIGCWKGGTVALYLDRFKQYFQENTPIRDMGWLASEVRGSVPLSDHGDSGPLAIDTNVYEFYPIEEDGQPDGRDLLRVDQLEAGKRYFVYITTHAGLYRYDMNDILEVTGFYGKTPLVRFVQKGKGVVSFTGEKLYEEQLITAVDHALAKYKGQFQFITTLGEMHGDKPRYVFLIEFDVAVTSSEGKRLITAIEQAVHEQNVEYASKRNSHRLSAPVLRVIKKGQFSSYRRREVSKGKLDGQFKVLRITKDSDFASEFEALFDASFE